MADVDELLQRAVPRLGRGDDAADKLRHKLTALARNVCRAGPEKAARRGLTLDARRLEKLSRLEGEAFLSALLAETGPKPFALLFRRLMDELSAALKKKREGAGAERSSSGRTGGSQRTRKAASSERTRKAAGSERTRGSGTSERKRSGTSERTRKARPSESGRVARASGRGRKAPSEGGLRPISSEELAVPADALGELALPPDDDALELAAAPEIELAPAPEIELAPGAGLQVRMDSDQGRVADDEDKDARSAGERALERFRKSGDPDELQEARRLFKQAAQETKDKLPRGAALAGLAQAYLLAGEAEKAAAQAEKALTLFPHEPGAVGVLLRAKREGEGTRERVRATLLRGAQAFSAGDLQGLAAVSAELDRLAPQDPFGPLVALARALEEGVGPDVLEPLIGAAWARYPGTTLLGDLTCGPGMEEALARGVLRWVREKIEREGSDALSATVKNVESKENVVAGAVQLGLGLARVAIASRRELGAHEDQALRLLVGQALFSAQYYDQAKEVLAAARTLDRNNPQVLEINSLETQCGVMRRAFDKPGVKAKLGKFDGVGILHYRKALAARLQRVLAERDAEQGQVEGEQVRVVQALAEDPRRREKISARARQAELEDPFNRLAEVEAQLGELEDQARAAAEAPAPASGGGGMFSRMKQGLSKAVDKAKSAAKGAELALRKSVAQGKRGEAVRALARALRERPPEGWGDKELDAFLRVFDAVDSRLECLEEEANELRARVGRASQERVP